MTTLNLIYLISTKDINAKFTYDYSSALLTHIEIIYILSSYDNNINWSIDNKNNITKK